MINVIRIDKQYVGKYICMYMCTDKASVGCVGYCMSKGG